MINDYCYCAKCGAQYLSLPATNTKCPVCGVDGAMPKASSECPVCGIDTPHVHNLVEQGQYTKIKRLNAELAKREEDVVRLREELNNIGQARRFERSMFRDDSEFADWAQSRAKHASAATPSLWLANRIKMDGV